MGGFMGKFLGVGWDLWRKESRGGIFIFVWMLIRNFFFIKGSRVVYSFFSNSRMFVVSRGKRCKNFL